MIMEKLFNEEVMTLDTYIMVKLKEKTAQLSETLTKKNRSPISLSMLRKIAWSLRCRHAT